MAHVQCVSQCGFMLRFTIDPVTDISELDCLYAVCIDR